jgi:hypothetical protein
MMQDMDLVESLRQERGMDDEPVRQVREQIRQRLQASDPDEDLDIDMEASEL